MKTINYQKVIKKNNKKKKRKGGGMLDKEVERIRTYVRAGVVLCIIAGLAYLLIKHTGPTDGLIPPEQWKAWLEGAAGGAIFAYYFREKK